jgi:hypothetical protein
MEMIGDLEIKGEEIISQLKEEIEKSDFIKLIEQWSVKPSDVRNAELVSEATIALIKLNAIENDKLGEIMERFYKLGKDIINELYKKSGVRHISSIDKVKNLRDITIVFSKLLNIMEKCRADDYQNLSQLGWYLSNFGKELEEIFKSKDDEYSDEYYLIAEEGLVEIESVNFVDNFSLQRMFKLCENSSWVIAVPSIINLAKFGKYYTQDKEEIINKLEGFLNHVLSPIRIASAKGITEMILKYLPYIFKNE